MILQLLHLKPKLAVFGRVETWITVSTNGTSSEEECFETGLELAKTEDERDEGPNGHEDGEETRTVLLCIRVSHAGP